MGGMVLAGLPQGLAQGLQQGVQLGLAKKQYESGKELRELQIKSLKDQQKFEDDFAQRDPKGYAEWRLRGKKALSPQDQLFQKLIEQFGGQQPGQPSELAPVPEFTPGEGGNLGTMTTPEVGLTGQMAQMQASGLDKLLENPTARLALDAAGLNPNAAYPSTKTVREVDPKTSNTYAYEIGPSGAKVGERRLVDKPGLGAMGATLDRALSRWAARQGKEVGELTQEEENQAVMEIQEARMTPGERMKRKEAKGILKGVINGTTPVDTAFWGRQHIGIVTSLASEQGVDLWHLGQEWNAAKRMTQSLNSPQMVKYRNSIESTDRQLQDLMEMVGEQDYGVLRQWNKTQYNAALDGFLGQDSQLKAAQVEQFITDIIGGLAMVYSGGNSPTERMLEVASANLDKYWSKTTLENAIKLQRAALQYRRDALTTVEPLTPPQKKPNLQPGQPADPWGIR